VADSNYIYLACVCHAASRVPGVRTWDVPSPVVVGGMKGDGVMSGRPLGE
jgi:hypothetical protein